MKHFILTLFGVLFPTLLIVSLVRFGNGQPPLNIRTAYYYIVDNVSFDTQETLNNFRVLSDKVNSLTWGYQSIEDASFFDNVTNFFVNVGSFFTNVGVVVSTGVLYVVYFVGFILNQIILLFKFIGYIFGFN